LLHGLLCPARLQEEDLRKLTSYLSQLSTEMEASSAAALVEGGVAAAAEAAKLDDAAKKAQMLKDMARGFLPKVSVGGPGMKSKTEQGALNVKEYDAYSKKLATFLSSKTTASILKAKAKKFDQYVKMPAPRAKLCANARKMKILSRKVHSVWPGGGSVKSRVEWVSGGNRLGWDGVGGGGECVPKRAGGSGPVRGVDICHCNTAPCSRGGNTVCLPNSKSQPLPEPNATQPKPSPTPHSQPLSPAPLPIHLHLPSSGEGLHV